MALPRSPFRDRQKTAHASERERPDVAERRQAWAARQPDLDLKRLAFVDELGASTKMACMRKWVRLGERRRAPVPFGHWMTTTVVGALRLSGMRVPIALDGPLNGEAFRPYIEQVLAPTRKPGDIVVMGNFPAHKNSAICAAIDGRGAWLRYLPPNLPDFKPSVLASDVLR